MRTQLGRLAGMLAAMLAASLVASGCATTFQDARLVAPGRLEITPGFSGAGFTDEGESEYLVNTFGAQGQVGVHERLNLGIGYARFEDEEFEEGLNGLAFGPRIGLVPDRVAVAVPFSLMFGEDVEASETWQMHPTALFTVPISARVDLNPSARLLIPFCPDCDASDILVGGSVGLGIRLPLPTATTVRPEGGFLVNPGESGVVWMFGIGVSLRN
jgi:hypothetical protein